MFSRKHIAATFGIFALGISSAAMIGCGSSGGSSEERTEEPIETDPKPSAKEQLAELEAAIDFIDSILDNLNTAVDARSSQTSFQHHVILLEDSRQQLVTAKSDAPSAPAALDNADAAIAAVELAQPIDTSDAGATSPACGSEADSAEPAKTARKSIPRTVLPSDLFGAPARAKRCVPPRRFSAGANYRPRKHNYDERVLRTNRVAPFVRTLRVVEEEEGTREPKRVRFATTVSTVVGHGSHVYDDPAHEDGPEAALFDREFEPRRPPQARWQPFQPSPNPALDLDDDLDYSGRPPFSLSLVRLADERPFDNGDRQSPTWYELQPEPLSPSASAGPPAGDYDWVDLPLASDDWVDLPLASDWAAPHGGDSDSTRAHHEDSDSDDDGLGARSHFFGEGDFLALPTPKSNPGRRAEAKFAQVIGVVQRGTDPNSQRITRFGIDSDAQDGDPFEQLRVALSDDEIYNVFGTRIQGTDKVFVRIRSVDPVSGREVAQVGTAEVSTRDGRLITAIHHLGRSSRLAEHDQTTRF